MSSSADNTISSNPRNTLEIVSVTLLLLVGFVQRIQFIFSDLERLLSYIPDDAFYYLQTALNFRPHLRFTFDGIYPANGFHPLWMALLVPVASVIRDQVALLRFALLLGAMGNLLTAIVLYLALKRLTKLWWISLIATCVYFLGFFATRSSSNGLETSLSTLLFILAFYICVGGIGSDDSTRSAVILGLVLGGLFLARTDNVFYILVFLVISILRRDMETRYAYSLQLLAVLAVVTTPWLIWNWLNFGSPIQSSGLAVPFVLRSNYIQQGHTSIDMLYHSIRLFSVFILARRDILGFAIIGFSIVVINRNPFFRDSDSERRRAAWMVVLLWLASIALIIIHTSVRWYPRQWYFHSIVVLEVITLSLFLTIPPFMRIYVKGAAFTRSLIPGKLYQYAMITLLIGGLILLTRSQSNYLAVAPYSHQVEMLDAAYWLRDNTSPDAKAASFNAGIIGYFSERSVINLDGAINTAAYEAITDRELLCLLNDASPMYYLDYDPAMLESYEYFLGEDRCPTQFVEVGEIDRPNTNWSGATIKIYQLD